MKTMVALSAVAVALEAKAQPYIAAALGSRLPVDTPLSLPAAYAGVVLVRANETAATFELFDGLTVMLYVTGVADVLGVVVPETYMMVEAGWVCAPPTTMVPTMLVAPPAGAMLT